MLRHRARLFLSLFAALTLLAPPVQAEVSRLEVTRREPYAGGRAFGAVGPYQRLSGRVYFEVDPRAKANRRVVDLELAPRNARGRVEFAADLEILAPADLSRANGTLLYDVNNRGNGTALGMFNGGADGFLMEQGFVVVTSGWIAELLPGGGRLLLDAPVARSKDGPITGLVRAEMAPDRAAERLSIAHWANHGSYPPTAPGLREATLTVRLREADPRVPVPRDRWELVSRTVEAEGRRCALPLVELELKDGFRPGSLYELIYEAEGPLVQGLGLAGIRDLVSFLKCDASGRNPLRGPDGQPFLRRAIGFGTSQSGRCLRMLLYDGFNADEEGKTVFEGVFPHVAGAGLGFFNHRFASPTRHNDQHDNHLYPADVFPFAYEDEKDPFTGRTDGILRRARAAGVVPKVIHTQTAAEYWHRSGSLVHTDPAGTRDAVLPPEVRVFAIGGAQHGPGSGIPGPRGTGQLPANPTDYRPLLRALLVALQEWIRDGKEPPPSRYPRIADGSLAGWREAESGWRAIPGIRYPAVIQRPEYLDYGPEYRSRRRLTVLPPRRLGEYRVRVPAYGPDDNDRGTLKLPSVEVPIGSYVGWNLRSPEIGAETELLTLTGGFIPFARTREEREKQGDPRPSLQERYGSHHEFRERTLAAARRLIAERLLLPPDMAGIAALCDRWTPLFQPD